MNTVIKFEGKILCNCKRTGKNAVIPRIATVVFSNIQNLYPHLNIISRTKETRIVSYSFLLNLKPVSRKSTTLVLKWLRRKRESLKKEER